jgi:hypothetical protein
MVKIVASRSDPRLSRAAARDQVREILRRELLAHDLQAHRFMTTWMAEEWRQEAVPATIRPDQAYELAFETFLSTVTREFFSPRAKGADAWRAQLDKLDTMDPRVERARQALTWWEPTEELGKGTWNGAAARFAAKMERSVPGFVASPRLLLLWAIAGGLEHEAPKTRAGADRLEVAWTKALRRARADLDKRP